MDRAAERGSEAGGARRPAGPALLALAIYVLALGVPFQDVFRAGIQGHLPIYPPNLEYAARRHAVGDAQWAATEVTRVAASFVPGVRAGGARCFPKDDTASNARPWLATAVVALPIFLLDRDPVVVWNLLRAALTVLAAWAMFLLVRAWTGRAAAGFVAGFVFAYSPVALGQAAQALGDATVFFVLALYLAERALREAGAGRGFIPAAAAASLALLGGPAAFVSIAVLAIPLCVWLGTRIGREMLRRPSFWAALGLVLLAATWAYASLRLGGDSAAAPGAAGELDRFSPAGLLPGERLSLGWWTPLLIIAAFLPGARAGLRTAAGDPRWALAVGFVAVCLLASGAGFDAFVYPLGVTRPMELFVGARVAACGLAGIGVASILARVGAHRRAEAAFVLALATVAITLLTNVDGLPAPVVYHAQPTRPSAAALDVMARVDGHPGHGAVLDLATGVESALGRAPAIMLSARHMRSTSVCSAASTGGPETVDLADPAARAALRAAGFEIVLTRGALQEPDARARAHGVAALSDGPGAVLERIGASPDLNAYAIRE